jgi:hypothetical protein
VHAIFIRIEASFLMQEEWFKKKPKNLGLKVQINGYTKVKPCLDMIIRREYNVDGLHVPITANFLKENQRLTPSSIKYSLM